MWMKNLSSFLQSGEENLEISNKKQAGGVDPNQPLYNCRYMCHRESSVQDNREIL